MSKTSIEWTEATWNPIVSGCSIVSAGCTNCYAMQMANRLAAMGQTKYEGLTRKTSSGRIVWNGKVNINLNDKALFEPLNRKKPTMYFVNSMTDLFQESVPFEAIDKIMAVIALCPQHTFQVLTKRPERMKEYFAKNNSYYNQNIEEQITEIARTSLDYFKIVENCKNENIYGGLEYVDSDLHNETFGNQLPYFNCTSSIFPLPNLWLGVSVENQEQAEKRIPILLDIPAKVRFLSCEPLLDSILFRKQIHQGDSSETYQDLLNGEIEFFFSYDEQPIIEKIGVGKIDWVIVGGESGKGARPMHPDWVRSIRNQCQNADVPFFFKQWGEYDENGIKAGKHAAGRLLDGVEYNEMPKIK